MESTLGTRRIHNLGRNVIVCTGQSFGERRGREHEIEHLGRQHAVAVEQVFDARLVHSVGARKDRPFIPGRFVPFSTEQRDIFCDARRNLAIEGIDGGIHGILGHDAVGRPLASGDDDEPRHAVRHDVFPAEFGSLV